MFAQFHDILPGSSIQPVEEAGIRVLDHGLEMASRIRGKAFFKLSAGQKQAKEGELPILVYNPHPFKHSRVIDCEFMLSDQNYRFEFSNPVVYQGNQKLPSQAEKEMSNIPIDWRKRVLFEAELEPLSMNRFDVRIEVLSEKPAIGVKAENGKITIANECYRAVLNTATGWLDSYQVDGKEYLRPGAGKILIQQDIEDSWGSTIQGFPETAGEFALADPSLAARIAGVQSQCLEPVRVIEDGEIRTVVEALFGWENSRAVVWYYFPKTNSEIRIHVRTIFSGNEKMLKLSIPTTLGDAKYLGRTAFGIDELRSDGNEAVAQEYVILADEKDAVSVINTGNYGSDCRDGEIRMSLLRTPAYCAYAIKDRQILPQDQFSERMDQGERLFDFYLNASGVSKRMRDIEQESSSIQEPPMAVCFFPPETGQTPSPLAIIDNPLVKLSAIKKAADGDGMILRVFNASFETQTAIVQLPIIDKQIPLKLGSFEVRTFRLVNGLIKDSTLCEDL
jgi:alpha-mannosidase